MSLAEELQKLDDLYRSGALTHDEFSRAKALLLSGNVPIVAPKTFVTNSAPMRFLRSLSRSNADYWIGGVCGGLGEHTGIPSWCWRIMFCVLLLGYGIGVIPYIVLWICLPTSADLARAAAFQDAAIAESLARREGHSRFPGPSI
jgi:phage shock protein PspC (stress-responsive transcriptional regulator)